MGEFFETLQNHGYGIHPDEILQGKLDTMIQSGLKVVAICALGEGRSEQLARELIDTYHIPSVYIQGGLERLLKGDYKQSRPFFINSLNKASLVALPITFEEFMLGRYREFILQLTSAKRFNRIKDAIDDIGKRFR